MGKGTDAARALGGDPIAADVIDDLKDQLLIAFVRRLGGVVSIPVREVDETGRFILSLLLTDDADRSFVFTLTEKQ